MMTTTNFIFTCGGRTIPSGGGSSANGSGGTWSRSRSIHSSPSPSPWHLEQEQEHLVLVQELQGAVVQCWEMSGGQLFWIFFIQVHLGGIVMGWGVVVTAASLDIKKICQGVFFLSTITTQVLSFTNDNIYDHLWQAKWPGSLLLTLPHIRNLFCKPRPHLRFWKWSQLGWNVQGDDLHWISVTDTYDINDDCYLAVQDDDDDDKEFFT